MGRGRREWIGRISTRVRARNLSSASEIALLLKTPVVF